MNDPWIKQVDNGFEVITEENDVYVLSTNSFVAAIDTARIIKSFVDAIKELKKISDFYGV